jgi:hypothetical protein
VPALSPPEVELELPDDCFGDEDDCFEDELPEPLDAELAELPEECCAVAARDAPGRVTATPAAASTLAAPAAIVTDRSLEWCRSRAAIAACRECRGLPSYSVIVIPSG